MSDHRPRVKFAVRRPAGDGRWWYESIDIPSPGGSAFVPMTHPPAVGDLISLHSRTGLIDGGPSFRVVERYWMHSGWGSADFPYGESEPRTGPLMDIIVEPADGVYRDEADICAEPDCSAVLMFGEWRQTDPGNDAGPHDHTAWRPSS